MHKEVVLCFFSCMTKRTNQINFHTLPSKAIPGGENVSAETLQNSGHNLGYQLSKFSSRALGFSDQRPQVSLLFFHCTKCGRLT